MGHARVGDDGEVHWVEVCFCTIPLAEERPYWEKYFELLSVTDAHARGNCRDLNGTGPWACCDCDCTKKLEERLAQKWDAFLPKLRERAMWSKRPVLLLQDGANRCYTHSLSSTYACSQART
jgi:hypothetical protein